MANYLGYEFIDSATVIFFDENGNFDAEKTDKVLSKKLEQTEKAVIPGFYGAGPDGKVVTFSRGGFGYHWFHRVKGMSCQHVRELDRCFRLSRS